MILPIFPDCSFFLIFQIFRIFHFLFPDFHVVASVRRGNIFHAAFVLQYILYQRSFPGIIAQMCLG